jgi:hypothetical protein
MTSASTDRLTVYERLSFTALLGLLVPAGICIFLGVQALNGGALEVQPSDDVPVKLFKVLMTGFGYFSPRTTGITLLAFAGILLAFGLWYALYGTLRPPVQLVLDADGISAGTGEGSPRIAWPDVTAVKLHEGKLLITGRGPGMVMSLETEELGASIDDIRRMVHRHRSDLTL